MFMQLYGSLDHLPLPAIFAATVALIALSLECGFRAGRWRIRRPDHEQEVTVRTEVVVMLGLVAFILAFTFWIAASHFDAARQALLNDANAIKTTYLRADLLPEPHRVEIRNLLREYIDIRLESMRTGQYDQAIPQLEEIHRRLWSQAVAASEKVSSSFLAGHFTQSLNEMISLHTRRVVVRLEFRIPKDIWVTLYVIVTIAAMSVGCHAGLTGALRPLVAMAWALIFSIVILLIVDLDNPQRGALKVGRQAMEALRRTMNEPNR
jgi:hypothetical protein